MTLSIFILEDDLIQAESMKRLIETLCINEQLPYQFIMSTGRPNAIIDKIPHCSYIPIYFLDIELKNEVHKGLEIAQQIRRLDDRGIIVFVSTHTELAPISYRYMVSALTFIDKQEKHEVREQQILACLKHYAQRNSHAAEEQYFVVDTAHTTLKLPFHTIEYMMTTEPHRIQLVTTKQLIQFYGTLKEMEAIDHRLVRCHKSYIVNLLQIKELNPTELTVTLKTGKVVPSSRRMFASVKKRLREVNHAHI